MLITPLPLNTRHAGPRQAAVGPGALRQLICDTTKVNTGAAETTDTDREIATLRERVTRMAAAAADPLAPSPLRDRAAAQASRAQDVIDRHESSRPAAVALDGVR
jgi:hypothetical protein